MHFDPGHIFRKAGKAARWAGAFGVASLLAVGMNAAIANIYSGPGIERAEEILRHTSVRGHVTGSGLSPDTRIQVTILTPGGETHDIWTETDSNGLFVLPDLDLVDPEAGRLEVRIGVFNDDPLLAPHEFALTLDKSRKTVDVGGRGLAKGSKVEVFFDGEPEAVSLALADWSGNFRTGPVGNAPVTRLKGQVCIQYSDASAGGTQQICFSQQVSSNGLFTLVAAAGGGGGLLKSPFSTWMPPANCTPAGTILGVCLPGHIMPYWQHTEVLNFVRAAMGVAQQFSVAMVQQMEIFGAFLDAKEQLEVQRWIQEKQAETHRDYHPSRQICYYGTFAQDFTNLIRTTEHNARALNSYFLDRELGPSREAMPPQGSGAPAGPYQDFLTRYQQFASRYCDQDDNGPTGLEFACNEPPPAAVGADINYTRFGSSTTLDIDFLEAANTETEIDVLALGKNLFAHELLTRPTRDEVFDQTNDLRLEGARALLDMRTVSAMRSVIRDSFSQITALKTPGAGLTTQFITAYLQGMNLDDDAIAELIGPNPSKAALLNVMMNKMPQNPSFYTELYDTEANVERVRAAMQAVENMGAREAFESQLRKEMTLSMRLELRLRELQDDVDSNIQRAIESFVGNAAGGGGGGP